jgi:hypothetical protein
MVARVFKSGNDAITQSLHPGLIQGYVAARDPKAQDSCDWFCTFPQLAVYRWRVSCSGKMQSFQSSTDVEESSSMASQEDLIVPDDVKSDMLMPSDLKRFHVESQLWCWKQSATLSTWQHNGSTGFLVARDKTRGNGEKMYGLFLSPESFFEELRSIHPHHRCFYELIPHGQPCRAYADPEWLRNP